MQEFLAAPPKPALTQTTLSPTPPLPVVPTTTETTTGLSFPAIMEQVGKFCQPYFEKLDELATQFATLKQTVQQIAVKTGIQITTTKVQGTDPPSSQVPLIYPPQAGDDQIFETLKQVCEEIDETVRYGGEIPLPKVWEGVEQRGMNLPWIHFQDVLLRLEDERKIDLHIANDPSLVRFPDQGITVPGRGLIYYLSLRK